MYQRILVAVDGSEISELALAAGVRLAETLKATLCIAHGIDTVTANAYKGSDRDSFLQAHIEKGRTILQKAGAFAHEAGIDWEERLLEIDTIGRSRLPEAIVQEADACEADLILVGTHARRGVSHLLLGSVAEGVVHIASKPVLVVPEKARRAAPPPEGHYRKLLVAVDGTEISAPALRAAIGLARGLRSTLRVVYAADPVGTDAGRAADILRAAADQAGAAGVDVETQTLTAAQQTGAIADAVAADAVAWPADLIVLGTHGRHGLDRLRLGSVAEGVLHEASIPVLLVRAAGGQEAQ